VLLHDIAPHLPAHDRREAGIGRWRRDRDQPAILEGVLVTIVQKVTISNVLKWLRNPLCEQCNLLKFHTSPIFDCCKGS